MAGSRSDSREPRRATWSSSSASDLGHRPTALELLFSAMQQIPEAAAKTCFGTAAFSSRQAVTGGRYVATYCLVGRRVETHNYVLLTRGCNKVLSHVFRRPGS